MGPHPAVAAIRLAVRHELVDVGKHPVVVACSGGADSLALLAATVFEARKTKWRVVGVSVDHGLQEGSADRAGQVVEQMRGLGVNDALSLRVDVTPTGQGPEAAARDARYAALGQAAQRIGSDVILLGHTLDDQAETMLLGLTRGSGGRAIGGMRSGPAPYRRPLLRITRAQTEAACAAEGIEVWRDPHNKDPAFTRARIRHRVLPVMEAELPGVAVSLARTAELLQQDLDALEEIVAGVRAQVTTRDGGIDAPALETQPVAISSRVLRGAAIRAGSPPSELFRVHVDALVDLMCGSHRSGAAKLVELPGHVTAYRDGGTLRFRRTGGRAPETAVGG